MPGFRINRYRLSDPILILRTGSALTGGFVRLSWTQRGKNFDRALRIVHFWVKDRGTRRLACTQLTRRPEAG